MSLKSNIKLDNKFNTHVKYSRKHLNHDSVKPYEINYFGNNTNWVKAGQKNGGARDAGELGGIYVNKTQNIKALIKKDFKVEFNISEFLGAKIFQEIEPQYGANVFLTVPESQVISKNGSNVYVRSEFIENYSNDLFADIDRNLPKKDKPTNFLRKDGRPLFAGTRELFSDTLQKAFTKFKYSGFEQVAPISLLIGDFDIHTGNIGVIRVDGQPPKLARIDFGWALCGLESEIHPHSRTKHLPGKGPTNHFREFPRKLKLNDDFVEGLFRASKVSLDNVIDRSFKELQKYYTKATLIKWAIHAMPHIFANKDNIQVDDIKAYLKDIMGQRQASLKEFGVQIKLGLLITKNEHGNYILKDSKAFLDLIKNNLEYFKQIDSGHKELKLRDKTLSNANDFLHEAIKFALIKVGNHNKIKAHKVKFKADKIDKILYQEESHNKKCNVSKKVLDEDSSPLKTNNILKYLNKNYLALDNTKNSGYCYNENLFEKNGESTKQIKINDDYVSHIAGDLVDILLEL